MFLRQWFCSLIKQFNATGEVIAKRKQGCGRKPKLSERELRKIHRQSLGNPGLTAREVQGAVGGSVVQASLRTVQLSIRKVGLIPYRPSFGPSHLTKMGKRQSWVDKG